MLSSSHAKMTDSQSTRRAFRYRISALLWLVFSVACFLFGVSLSHRFMTSRADDSTVHLPAGQIIQLGAGKSTVLSSRSRIPTFSVDDEAVCKAIPLSANEIRVEALSSGQTRVNLWDGDGKLETVTLIVP